MDKIVRLSISDSKEMALIHVESFPNFFLTKLGVVFLENFYSALILDSTVFSFGLKKGNLLSCFFVATNDSKGLYLRIFTKHFFSFFFPLLKSLISDPFVIIRLFVSFASLKKHRIRNISSASLLSICVSPEYSGNGLGKLLINKLEIEFINNKIGEYYLTTDSDNNLYTNTFYVKNGFILKSVFYQGKRKMNLFIKKLL